MADNKTDQVETNLALLNRQKPRAVVLDGDGWAWQNGGEVLRDRWYRCIPGRTPVSSAELAKLGPITATAVSKKKPKHKKPKGFVHTSRPHYDAQHALYDYGPGTVVIDAHGGAWQKSPLRPGRYIAPEPGYWYGVTDGSGTPFSGYELAYQAPFTALVPAGTK